MLAWRAGLWILLLAAVSGFAMAHLGRHSVGGLDGGGRRHVAIATLVQAFAGRPLLR